MKKAEKEKAEKKIGLKERMNFPSVPIITPPKKKSIKK